MSALSGPVVRADEWMLLGAVVQCVLVLRARRFELHDWVLPLLLLIGGSLGWFGFIVICSDVANAAPVFFIGFLLALSASGLFLADAAPPRLSAPALLSLTITFWAVYWTGGLSRAWLVPAVPMTAASLWFAWYPQMTPAQARLVLQAWSLSAAAAIAVLGIPTHVPSVMGDYRVEELAHTLSAAETFVTGAQALLFAMLACGVLMLVDPDTWRGWVPSKDDRPPRWSAIVVLMGQGAVLTWALRRGAEVQGQLFALSVLGALAHGAMTGEDADGLEARVDPALKLSLSRDDVIFLQRVRGSFLAFFRRRVS